MNYDKLNLQNLKDTDDDYAELYHNAVGGNNDAQCALSMWFFLHGNEKLGKEWEKKAEKSKAPSVIIESSNKNSIENSTLNSMSALKIITNDEGFDEEDDNPLEIEFEVCSIYDLSDPRQVAIMKGLSDLEDKISENEKVITKLNSDIDNLTNHADGFDYIVAVASGVLCGIIDSIFVGEIDVKSATEAAEKKVADKVKDKALREKQEKTVNEAIEGARKKGKKLSKEQIQKIKNDVKNNFYSDPNNLAETGQDPVLKRAIRFLAKEHPVPQDNLYVGTGSSPSTHHLDDIAHHASLTGMIASIIVQFFRVATFVNKDGKWSLKFVKTDAKELVELWLPIVISGLLNWLVCIAENNTKTKEGKDLPEPIVKIAHLLASAPAIIQVIKAVDNWCLHLYSDVAGSESSKGRGAGIPGLFISLLKELSSIPPLNFTDLPKAVEYLYATQKIDLRTEMGIAKELGRQAIPVIINEVLVRTFYFVRRLVCEYKKQDSFAEINWQNVIPFGNRTVERMMTIATGTFTVVDLADAAIRTATDPKTAGAAVNPGAFIAAMALRVNFVGIGRFVIAVGTDVAMGIKKSNKENQRMRLMSEQLALYSAAIYYKDAGMWIAAENAGLAIEKSWDTMIKSVEFYKQSLIAIENDLYKSGIEIERIREYNPEFIEDLLKKVNRSKDVHNKLLESFGDNEASLSETTEDIKKMLNVT